MSHRRRQNEARAAGRPPARGIGVVHNRPDAEEETTEDLLGEVTKAVKTGHCPHCGTLLAIGDDDSMRCPKCLWACYLLD